MIFRPRKQDTDETLYTITILAGTVGALALAVKATIELIDTIRDRNLESSPVYVVGVTETEALKDEDEPEDDAPK